MNKEAEKFMKTIKTIMTIFAIVFFAAIILTIAQGFFEVEIIDTTIFFIIAPIFVIGFTIFVIVKAFKGGKKYREELMTTKVPRRIKYVDTFYYYRSYYQGTELYNITFIIFSKIIVLNSYMLLVTIILILD